MSAFGQFADYYDLFYQDKNYLEETGFVQKLLRKHSKKARSLLELGCGTGRHAQEFAGRGFTVDGIDLSARMVSVGNENLKRLPGHLRRRIHLAQGDVTLWKPRRQYDAALSLFHVVNYQVSNQALRSVFKTARTALRTGGLFIFDFWHGAAVLTDRPAVRIKRIRNSKLEAIRLAEPEIVGARNLVKVVYTIVVRDLQDGKSNEFREEHNVRYLFLPEIELLADEAGFAVEETGQWLTCKPLDDRSWYGYAVLRARRP